MAKHVCRPHFTAGVLVTLEYTNAPPRTVAWLSLVIAWHRWPRFSGHASWLSTHCCYPCLLPAWYCSPGMKEI